MIQLKPKDIKPLRLKWYNEQNGICPILKNHYPVDKFCVDHQHKLVNELPSSDGKGLCRGAIHFQANALEGKIVNAFKRLGLPKHIDLIDYLRNLADYLESNKIQQGEKFIHPTESPRKLKLMKSSYNELVKAVGNDLTVPMYKNKRGNLTVVLERLYAKYKVTPKCK